MRSVSSARISESEPDLSLGKDEDGMFDPQVGDGVTGEPKAAERDSEFVQSLARGLAVIRAFGQETPELTLSEVARSVELTRAATRRFLRTLMELGYVHYDGHLFRLKPKVLELGYSYLSSIGLPQIAHPHLAALMEKVRETVSMTVLDERNIVYVSRVPARRFMRTAMEVGTRVPAYATSSGRVLMAEQPDEWIDEYLKEVDLQPLSPRTTTDPDRLRDIFADVVENGYCIVDQELELGIRSIAVPVHNAEGAVLAAVSVSGHASRVTHAELREDFLPAMLQAVSAIEADLLGSHLSAPRPPRRPKKSAGGS
ncbi:IclR family transcriptional regulator domain-containing protein [Amycolatopsis pigmentata]|uniref:IclR family transcriptional regulator C-terminal domain-containing protein n=1 Tax=Amycolatopsis pigmentata TaxID=450801 RepID=A0ABW5G5L7_9PSEU